MENQQCVDLRKILEQFSELQGPCAGCLRPGEGALPDRSYSCAALEAFDDAQRIRKPWRPGVSVRDRFVTNDFPASGLCAGRSASFF